MRPGYWQTLSAENLQTIRSRARPLSELAGRSGSEGALVEALCRQLNMPMNELVFLPLVGRKAIWTAVMDAEDLEIVGYLPVDGF